MPYPSMFPSGQTSVDPLEVAMQVVRDYCGWHVTPIVEEDLVLDGSGQKYLLLPSKHVLDVSSVIEDGHSVTVVWSQTGVVRKTAHDVTNYPLTIEGWQYPDGHGHWTSNERGVALHIKHGYEATEVASVLGVVQSVAARVAMNPSGVITNQRAGTQGFTMVPGSVPLMAGEMRTLDRYRLHR